MATFDAYAITDTLNDNLLNVVANRLEARGKHPFFNQMLNEYLDIMDIDSAQSVLDLGCGTGVAARAIARRSGFKGKVLGIDISAFLAKLAAQLAKEEGYEDSLSFKAGDSRSLELADSSFDAVVLHTLVSHLDNPLAALLEAARVVKPGGMIGIFDGDYASLTFSHEDPTQGQQNDQIIVESVVTQPRIMRQLPRLLKQAKLEFVASKPYVLTEVGKSDFWTPALNSFEKLMPASGSVSEARATEIIQGIFADSEKGVFFGSSNYYSYIAKRPIST